MYEFLATSSYFGLLLSILTYLFGSFLQKKFKLFIFNPLLLSFVLVILVLVVGDISYETYNESAKYITYLLKPATVALAVPLYEKLKILKENLLAVLVGIISGIITSFLTVLLISFVFGVSQTEYITLLPKSVTSAIGMDLSAEFGGSGAITTALIVVTGIFGNVIAEKLMKVLRIKSPVAKGIAIGTASHAGGTSKAVEMGEVEGAMSGLSIAVSGLLTVVFMNIFVYFY